jgi:AcrR family transcriptional regulator
VGGTHDARQRILDAAIDLIGQGGIRAATPAAVAERAGASKMSLYRHFAGKDELLDAALRENDARIRRRVLGPAWPETADPRARLLGMFAAAAVRAQQPGYTGCPYVICGLEAADEQQRLTQAGAEHKDAVITELTAAAEQLGAADPAALAQRLLLLFDGAVVHCVLRGDGEAMREAGRAAAILIDATLG